MSENKPTTPRSEQELVDALAEGIIVLDADRKILWWNKAAKSLLALKQEHTGCLLGDVIKGPGVKRLFAAPEESITVIRRLGRKTLHLVFTLTPYRQSKQILTIQDITKQRRAELMRKDFIGNVSHELRTPLTVFRGYLELLSEQPEAVAGKEETVLSQMSKQCQRMETLINGVLLLSRLEDDEPDPATHLDVDMASLIQDIVADAKQLSDGRHEFVLEIDENLSLCGHPMELRSLFSNIIYNAVNYSPLGGKVLIRWYGENGNRIFTVTDKGIGMAAKHLDKITQRFYRVDKSRQYRDSAGGGTGLGLAIVKHVLLRHEAELRVESELNVGSTFACFFPQ